VMDTSYLLIFISLFSSITSYGPLFLPSSTVVGKRNVRADSLLSDLLSTYVKTPQQQQALSLEDNTANSQSRSLYRGSSVLSYHGVPTPTPFKQAAFPPQKHISEPQTFQTFSNSALQPLSHSAPFPSEQTKTTPAQFQSFFNPITPQQNSVEQSAVLDSHKNVKPSYQMGTTSNVIMKPFTFFNSPRKEKSLGTFFSTIDNRDAPPGQQSAVQDPTSIQTAFPQNTFQQSPLQQNTFQENTFLENTPQQNTLQLNTLQKNTLQENKLQQNTLQQNTLQQNTLQENAFLENTPQQNTLQQSRFQSDIQSTRPSNVFAVFAKTPSISQHKIERIQQQPQPPTFSQFSETDPRQNEVGVDNPFQDTFRPTHSFFTQPFQSVQRHQTGMFQSLESQFGQGINRVAAQQNQPQFAQKQPPPQPPQKHSPIFIQNPPAQPVQRQFVQPQSHLSVQPQSPLSVQPKSPQSLFETINQPAPDREVRKKQDRKSGKKKMGKSAALTQLMAIAGENWEEKLLSGKDNLSAETTPDYVCPLLDGLFPSPTSCAVYYQCAGGIPHKHSCQAGLVFNTDTLQCDWAESVACGLNTP